ncbi:P-II family nitrogen regulator [Candidatus Cyanaurora vandensis]|uniref:P-II family nitrogen regulator n=1 Tax=Candidatus Cyanaurora vandensis TaxID=2714958 RepID=UPI00257CC5A2|nr:hypothetical protein [Candidatus Cyanaurora vandensis]
MKSVKRIEIVVDSVELNRLVEVLEESQLKGYTVIKDVLGRGLHGLRDGGDLTDVLTNVYVLVACNEDQVHPLIEQLRPILTRFGGICLISDAQWVVH